VKEVLLCARDLSAGYEGKAVLEQLSFSLPRGELLALIGPNGGGKSTLLKTLARQLTPLAGTVTLDGADLGAVPALELARRLSVLLTDRVNPERMTCAEVVSTGRYPYTGRLGILSPSDWQKVDGAMALLRVSDLARRPFTQLSDGQRQRVMVARALCQEPELLLLDEPTSYLDVGHKLELLELLRELAREQNLAVVLSLHELDLAQRSADRVLCVREGRAVHWGTPEEIFTREIICGLYDLPPDSYEPSLGSFELSADTQQPRVFVIGGGGLGIPVYRKLRRQGIPFAAGVLQENDLDCPVARSLSSALVTEQAFEPVGERALNRAAALLEQCETLICCPERFGTQNRGNERLLEAARGRMPCLSAKEYLFEDKSV
jgi:iron complex transport system ATP-binding protein